MNVIPNILNLLLAAAPMAPPVAPERPGLFNPSFIIVMLIFIVAFIFLIDRPNRKRQEEKQKAVESMKKGDPVVSIGGIHGTVVRVNKEKGTVIVNVAKGVELEFNKTAVNAVPPEKAKESTAPAAEEKKAV